METNLFESVWYMELSPEQKLFWYYLNSRCDNVGVWEPNLRLAGFHLGIDTEGFLEAFIQAINTGKERVKILQNGSLFLTGFVKFQYSDKKPLSTNNPAHRSYLNQIDDHNLTEWFCESQPEVMPNDVLEDHRVLHPKGALQELSKTPKSPFKESSESHKDKEKETDKEQEEDKETDTETDKETSSKFDSKKPNSFTGEALTEEGYPKTWDTPLNDV